MFLLKQAKSVPATPIIKALNEWREQRGFTWADIARISGVDDGTLSNMRLRTKNLDADVLMRMGINLGIHREELFKYVTKMNILLTNCPLELLDLFTTDRGKAALIQAMEAYTDSPDIGQVRYDYNNER